MSRRGLVIARLMSEIIFTATSPQGRVARIAAADDIASIRVEQQGTLVYEGSLALTDTLDYGYEGCHAGFVQWFGETLIVITHERGRHYVRAFEPEDFLPSVPLVLSSRYVVAATLLCWIDTEMPGLVRVTELPRLQPLVPLPKRGSETRAYVLRAGDEEIRLAETASPETLRLPAAHQRVTIPSASATRIEAALHELLPAHALSALVIAAAAHPFWMPPTLPYQPPPTWLPVYWYQYLLQNVPAHAGDFLDLLHAVAAPLAPSDAEVGWHRDWTAAHGAVMLAARHVQRMAALYSEVCRTGRLPSGWWCLFFEPAPQRDDVGSRVDVRRLPAALRPYFTALVPTQPRRLR